MRLQSWRVYIYLTTPKVQKQQIESCLRLYPAFQDHPNMSPTPSQHQELVPAAFAPALHSTRAEAAIADKRALKHWQPLSIEKGWLLP